MGHTHNKGIPSTRKIKYEILDLNKNVIKVFNDQLQVKKTLRINHYTLNNLVENKVLYKDIHNIFDSNQIKEYLCRKVKN
jgi:hypothetical protein